MLAFYCQQEEERTEMTQDDEAEQTTGSSQAGIYISQALRGRRYLCCGISCSIQCRSVRHNRSHIRLRSQCHSSTKPFWRIEGVVMKLKEIPTLH